MKIADIINNPTHSFVFISRFEIINALTLELFNEGTKVTSTAVNTHATVDGNTTISYTFTFADKDKYRIKILNGLNVVYRDKLIVTSQVAQDYKLSNDLYAYGN